MDCCNYVEAYAAGGHFYQQQQQYFSYDNANAMYAGYDAGPISNAIEINARYNGAIPPMYPTDYVYNPKEARLRKAMREQCREQSRERSRRSIFQSAIAIANARTAAAISSAPGVSASMANGFLNQHHRFNCLSAMPAVAMGPNISTHRATETWFQTAHRPKPIHSPRIGDWYGSVDGDPIERLQAMGAMHHQQQRSLEKSPIKDQRNQTECVTAAFSSNGGHPPDFAIAEREMRLQESAAEYADFDGQKWHPYQTSTSPHSHPRTPHPPSQISGILHPNIQNTNTHGHAHGPWGQFCQHGVLPHIPALARNTAVRSPRHTVFLRDRPPTRHCAFSEDTSRISYAPNKLDIDGIRTSYPPSEHQMSRLLESATESVDHRVIDSTMTTTKRERRHEEENRTIKWESNTVTSDMSLNELVPTSVEGPPISREKERECWHPSERFEPKKRPVSKQPLPGFHQAFGSTEIGKFSRSEFFVNMVGESSRGDVDDPDISSDVSRERTPLPETTESASAAAAAATVAATTSIGRSFDSEDQATFAVSDGVVGPSYCGQPRVPSWHSPHVGAIGSEI